ncbi:alpha-2,8-polysialyltransferase family protein [Streptomyces antimicrobicus]|uniref:Alpha-2,8-polysialyltransferase family protein n=1 Tax=Streptomyces antimicrobicus TaxID=2883108 RepID=A0ABS8BAU3_9ACTN|nr:alpha-2,8-polysialyltransferase family protein [Streptomyces antimicrobicus]MCB5181736.1 alpha-2,8-polysialyltransferase family protein [Streptomyces antimicrobicus]
MTTPPTAAGSAPRTGTGTGTTRIFLASTLYGVATLATALDCGAFPPAARQILLTSNNAAVPEVAPGIEEMPGFDRLRSRFDDVIDWNAAIAPFHPSAWAPRPDDVPLWERQLRALWGLGEDRVELVVESLQVSPAQALCRLFPGAAVDVYADGLMSYGPTRSKLDPQIGVRVRRVLHLDLVPGVEPLLLTEFGVPAERLPDAAFRKVLDELADDAVLDADVAAAAERAAAAPRGPALLLGQYLCALDLLTAAEEEELHAAMVRGAHALGHREVVFKPHPSAPARSWGRAAAEADALGVRFTVAPGPGLAEVLYRRLRPALVVGCFSTGLLTAATLYGLPVARTGTGAVLARLTPYQNSNRIPLVLVDALLPDLADAPAVRAWTPPVPGQAGQGVAGLVAAVGFTMQPQLLAARRGEAERYLAAHRDSRTWRYVTRRRLTALALPGGVPARLSFLPGHPVLRRAVRRVRRLRRAVARGR